ncbi:uncharacterized protein LOC114801180 [Denticeps clupeoides]|uniref:uncharacterized protein LOC114801180 n=1 Tax=Denticeps clupeoides TaxID=299321 RepID=UPI0010A2B7C5|nr:uncharacterized protein LOC114801180 [Denticeps clupeoides]
MQLEAAKLRADREARGLREKELAHQLQLKQLELEEHDRERQLHLKQMELEERDRERQFEHERQERDLELKRLELELASKSVLSVESQTPVFDCVLVVKAQEVYSSLSLQQSSDYDVVKTSILNAYELVPEAYRQRFRKSRKGEQLTYVEFAREKEALFNRWCVSSKVSTWEQLRELILLEEFKNCVPEAVATHLNDQKVSTLAQAAVCADEFVLTHKVVLFSLKKTRSGCSCKVAVRPELPMQGIDFILGNDLAGGKVLPLPEVIDNPAVPPSSVVPGYESVTRAQTRRQSTDELCDTFMAVSDPLVSRAAPSDGGVVEGAPRTRAVNGHDDETMSLPRPFKLEVDASAVGAGAVLLQEDAD